MNLIPTAEAKSITTAVACATPSADVAPRTRRVYTQQEKADYLALFEQSGMTQAEFAKEMSINEATLSLWRRTAREESSPAEIPLQFAEVQLNAPPPSASPLMAVVHLPCGAKLEVHALNDAAWHGLGLLLKTL